MLSQLTIRVDSTHIRLTGADHAGRAVDLLAIPRATGSRADITLEEMPSLYEARAARVYPAGGDAAAGGSPRFTPEINATERAFELAKEFGIDLRDVEGTGPNGRIYAQDVRDYAKDDSFMADW